MFAKYVGLSELNFIFDTQTILDNGEWVTSQTFNEGRMLQDRGFGIARSYDKAALFICLNIIINYFLYLSSGKNNLFYLY